MRLVDTRVDDPYLDPCTRIALSAISGPESRSIDQSRRPVHFNVVEIVAGNPRGSGCVEETVRIEAVELHCNRIQRYRVLSNNLYLRCVALYPTLSQTVLVVQIGEVCLGSRGVQVEFLAGLRHSSRVPWNMTVIAGERLILQRDDRRICEDPVGGLRGISATVQSRYQDWSERQNRKHCY